jgi:hypothetical protein
VYCPPIETRRTSGIHPLVAEREDLRFTRNPVLGGTLSRPIASVGWSHPPIQLFKRHAYWFDISARRLTCRAGDEIIELPQRLVFRNGVIPAAYDLQQVQWGVDRLQGLVEPVHDLRSDFHTLYFWGMSWTFQSLIDAKMVVTVFCLTEGCGHNRTLPLPELRDRFGPDASAMREDLIDRLKCDVCGERHVDLSYTPDTSNRVQVNRYRNAKDG